LKTGNEILSFPSKREKINEKIIKRIRERKYKREIDK
jgi:hypothetical protein